MSKYIDDKDLVIIAVLIISIYAMYAYPGTESQNIVMSAITGLFGVAVGKSMNS